MIALKQTCIYWRRALDLPGHLVSVGAVSPRPLRVETPLSDVTAARSRFSCLKKKGDFASGFHVFFLG